MTSSVIKGQQLWGGEGAFIAIGLVVSNPTPQLFERGFMISISILFCKFNPFLQVAYIFFQRGMRCLLDDARALRFSDRLATLFLGRGGKGGDRLLNVLSLHLSLFPLGAPFSPNALITVSGGKPSKPINFKSIPRCDLKYRLFGINE